MKLVSFRVRKFRNIIDSGDVDVESDVSCLVGMNEAGKTAVLTALNRLNPTDSDSFNIQQDYPRWLLTRDRRAGQVDSTEPIEAQATNLACGNTVLTNRVDGVSQSHTKSYTASNQITVQRACTTTSTTTNPPTTTTSTTNTTTTVNPPVTTTATNTTQQQPNYGCGDGFTFYKSTTRTIRFKTFHWVANHGAMYDGADINWGDGSAKQSAMDPTGVSHTYAADGQYTVNATLHFNVNGSAAKRKCSQKIRVQLQPTTTTTTTNQTIDSNNTIIVITAVETDNDDDTSDVATATTPNQDAASIPTPDATGSQPTDTTDTTSDTSDSTDVADSTSTSDDSKTLVNTGAGNVFAIFLAATIVGTIGSRLLIYRLLGA